MSRTNIEIDDKLIARVMERYGFRSKREAVDLALHRLDVVPMTRAEGLAMEGAGWEADLDDMRRMDPAIEQWLREQETGSAKGR